MSSVLIEGDRPGLQEASRALVCIHRVECSTWSQARSVARSAHLFVLLGSFSWLFPACAPACRRYCHFDVYDLEHQS